MHALRLLPALFLIFLIQLGLHRLLGSIFFARPGQAPARRRLGWALGATTLVLPLQIASIRAGWQAPAAVRWALLEPALAWLMFGLPLLALLLLLRSLVRRWPSSGVSGALPTHESSARFAAPLSPGMAGARASAGVDEDNQRLPQASSPDAPESGTPVDRSAELPARRRVFLARSAQLLLGGAGLLAARGIAEAEEPPEVSRTDIFIPGLHPDLDGLTILQLSDIHAGALITEERMQAFAAAAARLPADLIAFTGDLLDGSGRAAAPYARAFEQLRGRLGTFAILGNHDYYAGERFAIRAVRDAGQTLLRNSGVRISRGQGSLWLGGVDDPMVKDAGGSVDPRRALLGASPGEAKVLLAHRPGLFDLCAAAGAQLVLSGHTHGGQLAFSPTLTPARLLGRHTMGYYKEGAAQLYVHRGMGVVGAAPVRLGVPPELALLTLRRV